MNASTDIRSSSPPGLVTGQGMHQARILPGSVVQTKSAAKTMAGKQGGVPVNSKSKERKNRVVAT